MESKEPALPPKILVLQRIDRLSSGPAIPIAGQPAPAYCPTPAASTNSYYALGIKARIHNKPTRLFGPKTTPKVEVARPTAPPPVDATIQSANPSKTAFDANDILCDYPSPNQTPKDASVLVEKGKTQRALILEYGSEPSKSVANAPQDLVNEVQPLDPLPMYEETGIPDDPHRTYGMPPIKPTGLVELSIDPTYDKYRYEKALKLKTVLDTMYRPQMPPGFTLNIEHSLRVATININGIKPIKMAYIVQLLVLHDIDVLTVQDTRLSENLFFFLKIR